MLSTGGITKTGRRELRATLVTAAQQAVKSNAHWKAQYEHLAARISKQKAIIAIARKLLIAVWHVLTQGCADRFTDDQQVAVVTYC